MLLALPYRVSIASQIRSRFQQQNTLAMSDHDEERLRREEQIRNKIVLKELREHQHEIEADKGNALDCRSQVLTEHFRRAEENLEKTVTADQALLDAQIFHKLGEYSKRQAAQLSTGLQTFDVKTFMDNLVLYMQEGPGLMKGAGSEHNPMLDFKVLGNSLWKKSKKVPSLDFMHGLEPEDTVKQVKERKKPRRVKKSSTAIKPDEMKTGEVQQTLTDQEVARMKRELEKRKECNYWLFVLDPHSFTRSIENTFHSSFLVHDGMASIDFKVDPPMIRYIDPRDREAHIVGPVKKSEAIVDLSYAKYIELIGKHQVRQCLLPKLKSNNPELYSDSRKEDGSERDNLVATASF